MRPIKPPGNCSQSKAHTAVPDVRQTSAPDRCIASYWGSSNRIIRMIEKLSHSQLVKLFVLSHTISDQWCTFYRWDIVAFTGIRLISRPYAL